MLFLCDDLSDDTPVALCVVTLETQQRDSSFIQEFRHVMNGVQGLIRLKQMTETLAGMA